MTEEVRKAVAQSESLTRAKRMNASLQQLEGAAFALDRLRGCISAQRRNHHPSSGELVVECAQDVKVAMDTIIHLAQKELSEE